MFVRVVRFTDVTAERVESLVARIDETGPPPGVPIKKLQLVFDEAQGTAVVLQYFDTEENLRAGPHLRGDGSVRDARQPRRGGHGRAQDRARTLDASWLEKRVRCSQGVEQCLHCQL